MLVFRCILKVDNSLSEILLGELSHGVGSSLSVDHDAEAFEVGQVSSGSLLGNLLEGSAFLPLLLQVESLSSLSDGASAGSSENGQFVFGESKSLKRVKDTRHVFSINKHFVLISNV